MPQISRSIGRMAAALYLALAMAEPAMAIDAETRLDDTIKRIEERLDARVGLVIEDSGSDWSFRHRADERVLMNSTFKMILCGAVLQQVEDGAMTLDDPIGIAQGDILDYAPVTETQVDGTMTVGELCFATLDMSDNTAANLLIDHLGGPGAVTTFLRGIGDETGRLDRREPELNDAGPTGEEDTSTAAAMAGTLRDLLLGDALSPGSRTQLLDWMSVGGVTGKLLRASAPATWQIADKSGAGSTSRNLVALVTPEQDDPYAVSIFVADADVDFETRNAALIELSAAVIDLLRAR